MRWLKGLGLVAMLPACSEPAESSSDDPAEGSGGTAAQTGGSAGFIAPTATGPALDAAVTDSCDEIECDSTRIGSWELSQRCDQSGTWVDDECPEAQYQWSLQSAQGHLTFEEGGSEWNVSTKVAWSIDVPDSCGACDVQQGLSQAMDTLLCEATAGGCHCEGSATQVQDWFGTVYAAAGNGHWNLEEQITVELFETGQQPPEHEFWTCAGTQEMTVYDENGARLRFSRVE